MNWKFFKNNKTKFRGFTLVEIMVASTIFVIISGSMLSLFNYVLKINRRSEALKQASQGMRNFVEFLVKEIRNGQIDYYILNGKYTGRINNDNAVPCGVGTGGTDANPALPAYQLQDNKLGIINTDNVQECFYFGNDTSPTPAYVGFGVVSAPSGRKYTLMLQKSGVTGAQILNPPNLEVDNLEFIIRPQCDPYTSTCPGGLPKTQPSVTLLMKFMVQLPTGEKVPIYYQTSVSSNKYDIPSH